MTSEPGAPEDQPPEPGADSASPDTPTPEPKRESDAILPFGVGDRLDEIAQDRFNRTDWIELAAAILLAAATIMAAWSAYQATRWGGVQANSFSAAGAARTEATQAISVYAAQIQVDVQMWTTWLGQTQQDNEVAQDFYYQRFRDEFRPAFDVWLAQVPAGEIPPGTPFDMAEYQPEARTHAEDLNARADELAATAREANQRGDNFVLVAVIMASVLFFAGVGTKFKGRGIRLAMLTLALVLFIGGVMFTFSMPQNIGL